ncbi:fungal-specific transcription factor domain-containing protein [Phascolomyces articulosus]|uniref:Fungal-specific transcription factor domain-containing protein n=1 Tax=Phascolomyces articulosus TaxID=60185 RepID=A0AAD5JWA3_9FUNG|nr:fungal-specific transcription factor domain-containing protein [Phascolomyces articulosus]
MSKKTTSNAFQQSAAQPPGPTTTNNNHSTPKRVKVTLACIVCRKKKVKCDGIQPSCSRCNSMSLVCEYSDPPRKRGPPKGYIEVIENRAHRIESLLAWQHHPQLRMQQPATNKGFTTTTGSSNTTTTNINEQSKNNNILNHPVSTRDDHRSLLSLSAGPNSLLNLVSNAVSLHHDDPINNDNNKNAPGSHNRQSDFSLNNELKWAESFFAHFNLFFPLLSRQHFLYQLQHRPQEMNPLLRYAVLALGCRYAETQASHEEKEAGAQFFKQCHQQILNTTTTTMSHDNNSNITLSKLQAVVIMCWYAYLSGDMQMCRTYLYHQVQLVKDLKLHRDPDLSLGIVTMELRRRAFWVAYVTNQWLTSCIAGCDSTLLMHQQSFWDCRWPQLEDSQLQAIDSRNLSNMKQDVTPPSVEYALQITVFAEMIKLAHILDDHHYHHHQAVDNNHHHHHRHLQQQRLTNWFLNLPSYLEYNQPTDHGPPSPMIRVYHMLYYTAQIMLQHNHNKDATSSSLSDTMGICNTAANTIVHIAEQMIHHQQERYLYNTYLLSLGLATSIHLENARNTKTTPISLSKSIRVFKNANCTRLAQADLDAAVDHYVQHDCRLLLEKEEVPFGQQTLTNRKRKRSSEKSPPVSLSSSSTTSTSSAVTTPHTVDENSHPNTMVMATTPTMMTTMAKQEEIQEQQHPFDINDLLGLTGLFDNHHHIAATTMTNQQSQDEWNQQQHSNHDWFTTMDPLMTNFQQHQEFNFPTMETSSSSSGSLSSPTNSTFSPTHSPTLSCDTTIVQQQNFPSSQQQQQQSLQQDHLQQQKNNSMVDPTQYLIPYLDTLPLDIYTWDDFMPHETFDLME